MEEGKWAARVLSEIGSARESIAASYLALWRKAGQTSTDEDAQPPTPHVEGEADAGRPAPPAPDSYETEER
jgi:hypothetical protein